jgi:hypothetical protein
MPDTNEPQDEYDDNVEKHEHKPFKTSEAFRSRNTEFANEPDNLSSVFERSKIAFEEKQTMAEKLLKELESPLKDLVSGLQVGKVYCFCGNNFQVCTMGKYLGYKESKIYIENAQIIVAKPMQGNPNSVEIGVMKPWEFWGNAVTDYAINITEISFIVEPNEQIMRNYEQANRPPSGLVRATSMPQGTPVGANFGRFP